MPRRRDVRAAAGPARAGRNRRAEPGAHAAVSVLAAAASRLSGAGRAQRLRRAGHQDGHARQRRHRGDGRHQGRAGRSPQPGRRPRAGELHRRPQGRGLRNGPPDGLPDGADEDGRAARPHGDESGERRAVADVRRRLRPDGVRHRRDHGRARARRARLPLRAELRSSDRAGRRFGLRRGRGGDGVRRALRERGARQLRRVQRPAGAGGQAEDRRVARRARPRARDDELSPPRLAALASALLGLPDPRHPLRQLRDRARTSSATPTRTTTPRRSTARWSISGCR